MRCFGLAVRRRNSHFQGLIQPPNMSLAARGKVPALLWWAEGLEVVESNRVCDVKTRCALMFCARRARLAEVLLEYQLQFSTLL
jgi:hypothetical protein